MSTTNTVYHLGTCEICNEKEANAFFDCLIVSYCEDCIATVNSCPICEKPEDITILTFSDYGRKLNVRSIKNTQS